MKEYLDIFIKIWDAPAGKKLTAIFMIIPVAIVIFYQYNTQDLREDLKTYKKDNILLNKKIDTVYQLYVNEVKNCQTELTNNDNVHREEFEEYRKETEKKIDSIQRDWRLEYQQLKKTVNGTQIIYKNINEKLKS